MDLYHTHLVSNINFGLPIFLVASWRVKETERMIAVCTELRKASFLWPSVHLKSLHHTFFFSLTYELDISAGSNSWRRPRLLCDHSTGESQCDGYRHIRRSPNGHGILTCCLWRCSCYHQWPQLHPQNIPRLLWSPAEIYKALTSSFK